MSSFGIRRSLSIIFILGFARSYKGRGILPFAVLKCWTDLHKLIGERGILKKGCPLKMDLFHLKKDDQCPWDVDEIGAAARCYIGSKKGYSCDPDHFLFIIP